MLREKGNVQTNYFPRYVVMVYAVRRDFPCFYESHNIRLNKHLNLNERKIMDC